MNKYVITDSINKPIKRENMGCFFQCLPVISCHDLFFYGFMKVMHYTCTCTYTVLYNVYIAMP